jgi:hypothetical protein
MFIYRCNDANHTSGAIVRVRGRKRVAVSETGHG